MSKSYHNNLVQKKEKFVFFQFLRRFKYNLLAKNAETSDAIDF